MTLTVNPVMGSFSATYAVRAGPSAAFCSRFDFNMYSYESDLVLGCEIWRRQQILKPAVPKFTIDETIEPESAVMMDTHDGEVTGILKARVNQNFKIGLLWEGRFKQLLFSIGML